MKLESELQKLVRMSLAYWWKDTSHFEKEHGDEFTTRGVADIVGHIAGKYIAIECKMAPRGYPSKEQLVWMRRIVKTGGIAIYIIHEQDGRNDKFYFVNGDITALSYRDKIRWPCTTTTDAVVEGHTIKVIDMSPMIPYLFGVKKP